MTGNNKNKTIKTILIALGYFAVIFFVFFFILKKQEPVQENIEKFSKGVLAINTNKPSYKKDEKVEFGLASLDENGDTLCTSNLKITVTGPDGKKTELSTQNGTIMGTNTCNENNNVTSNPDYKAYFFPAAEGVYKVKLINLGNGNEKETQFEVKNDSKFSLEREGATRINPFATDRYHMILRVTSENEFEGKVVEYVPSSFNIIWQGKSTVEDVENSKKITWEVELKAGETKELIYEYQAPKVSPDFYELGKAQIFVNNNKIFEEIRTWHIASDDITFVGVSHNDRRGRSNTCDIPTNTSENDIMFAMVTMYSNTIRGIPSGWTSLGTYTTNSDKYHLYYKIAGDSEPDDYTWQIQSNGWSSITIVTYRGGFDIDNPIDVTSNTAYRTSSTAVQAASMSVTYGVSPLLFFGAVYSTSSLSYTKPSVPNTDWVEDVDYYNADGDFGRTVTSMTWGNTGPTGAISASASITTTTKHAFAVTLNPPMADIDGTVYTNEAKSSNIGSGKTVSLYVNDIYKDSVDTNSSGQFSFTDVTGVGTGNTIIVYLNDETENGSTIVAAGETDITTDIITDRVILENENGGSITNEHLDRVDGVDATNEDGITISSGNLSVANGFELFVPSGETFEPEGSVTTQKLHIKGTYTGEYETLTLTGSGTGACSASQSLTLPFCIDSGATYNANDNTTVFTGTGSSSLQSGSYNNIYLQPTITGNVTYTFTGGASTMDGNFTINPTSSGSNTLTVNMGGNVTVNFPGAITISGTTSALSVLNTTSGGNYSLSSGSLNIRAAGTLQANGSTITLTGSNYNEERYIYNSEQWLAPQGVTSVTVKIWGGGGGGGGGSSSGSGGGGGGEFRQSVVSITSGSVYTITVGQGGVGGYSSNGGNGTDSSFGSSVIAKGGTGGILGGSGGSGGSGGTGTTGYTGGSGAAGSGSSGGGGGEGAGSTANGGNASGTTGGTGTDGGDGGAGATARDNNGTAGQIPGGGGGGGGESKFATTRGGAGRSGLIIMQYDSDMPIFTRVGTFTQGTSTVIFSQTRDDATLNDGNITFYNLEVDISGYTGTLGGPVTVQNDFDITAGTLDDDGNQITGNSTGTLTAASGASLSLGGTSTATSFPTLFTNANIALNVDSTVIYNAGVSQYISGTPTYGNIVIYSDGVISDSTINVHGDWTCYGDITPGTSTVYLNGSGAQTVTGETNFYNLDITTATAKTVTFTQDAIVNILSGGNVNFEGASGNLLTLTSSSLAPWYLRLDPAATYSISYVNVSESNAGGYQTIYANDGTVTDGGLNINWVFAAPGTEILMNFNGINLNGVDIN